MKFLRQLSAATVLTFVLTFSAVAGEMHTGVAAPVTVKTSTSVTTQSASEPTGTPNASSDTATGSLITTVLNLLGNMLTLF